MERFLMGKIKARLGAIPIIDYYHSLKTLKSGNITVADEPYFLCNKAGRKFYSLLKESSYYAEFGSGGSTIVAAKMSKFFSSYEPSEEFLNIVKKKLYDLKFDADEVFDLRALPYGPMRTWGIPFPFSITKFLFKNKMKQYSEPHWEKLNRFPDLVLVDGRFRVACSLKTIKSLQNHDNWKLIVDDYLFRSEYKIIEKFAKLDEIVGSTAFFSKMEILPEINEAIKKYELDFR